MDKTTFEPPRCPYCGVNLTVVYETIYETYEFSPETGTYIGSPVDTSPPTCPKCDGELWDVFPDGVCNYLAKKELKKSYEDRINLG